jgi:hypothetical protein
MSALMQPPRPPPFGGLVGLHGFALLDLPFFTGLHGFVGWVVPVLDPVELAPLLLEVWPLDPLVPLDEAPPLLLV